MLEFAHGSKSRQSILLVHPTVSIKFCCLYLSLNHRDSASRSRVYFSKICNRDHYRPNSCYRGLRLLKGIVTISRMCSRLTLLYAGILFPSYVMEMVGEIYYKSSIGFTTEKSVLNAAHGYFFLGIGMVIFSMIIGYKPAILYTRNRPEPLDAIWKEYPIWYDNVNVVGGYNEPSVSLKSLMTTEEQYLLWRYELYSLTSLVHPIFVKPDGRVPVSSTIFRDKENLSMMGKAKYPGYFV